ncbi:PREDICTED: slit homolog 3 protein-like isoform X2 [Vollenhovia emeryi]|uniref:slit homolog 3 protein-like isoform X2 n=1 Tax=Vollenhovia emeryi TaxID=411798 RepID=UPI0005F4B61C|nr:PREDICTED: slit homolog 3 protein-like isoform X2 [Vollenhovia emeryi]
MTSGVAARTWLVVLVLDAIALGAPGRCPSLCVCDTWYELLRASCTGRHLYSIHTGAPSNVQALDLSNNSISILNNYELADLTLDSCRISHVPVDTFNGLSYLRTLDLSNNLMIQLDSNALKTIQFLRVLSIEGNPWSCDKLTHDLQIYLTHKNIEYRAVCAKSSEPKKFEKMVMYNPRIKYEKHRPFVTLNSSAKKNTTKKHPAIARDTETPTSTHENTIACANATDRTSFVKALNAISPYWFLTVGFLLGVACGMFTCYVWLTRKISCCRGYREQTDNDAQRVSLLQNLWQFEDSAANDSAISCPDTPPPPYREVMLRPGLYRNASVTTNLNNNIVTNSTGYT